MNLLGEHLVFVLSVLPSLVGQHRRSLGHIVGLEMFHLGGSPLFLYSCFSSPLKMILKDTTDSSHTRPVSCLKQKNLAARDVRNALKDMFAVQPALVTLLIFFKLFFFFSSMSFTHAHSPVLSRVWSVGTRIIAIDARIWFLRFPQS